MPKRKILSHGHAGYFKPKPTPSPRPQPIRLPSTAQIDARIRRQTLRYQQWRTQYLRLKDEGGRSWRGPRPTKPPGPVYTIRYDGSPSYLLFVRAAERRHPYADETPWAVPEVAVDRVLGPLYFLDSYMVMHEQFLRTEPRHGRLVVRGASPEESLVFRALSQEWVRVPSGRSSKFSVVGFHRWLCCLERLRSKSTDRGESPAK